MNTYTDQANDFLNFTGAKIEIKLADKQTCPKHWNKCEEFVFSTKPTVRIPHNHGLEYTVTLSREGRKPYTFSFWSSINDSYKREVQRIQSFGGGRAVACPSTAIKPTAYDILACLSGSIDAHCQDFEDWANDLGYDPDSRKAEKVYNAVCAESRALSRMFSDSELDVLREIN